MISLLLGVSIALGAIGVALASLVLLIWHRVHLKRRSSYGDPHDIREILSRLRSNARSDAIFEHFELGRVERMQESAAADEAAELERELARQKHRSLGTHRDRVRAAEKEVTAVFEGPSKHWLTTVAETAGVLSLLVALIALVLTII